MDKAERDALVTQLNREREERAARCIQAIKVIEQQLDCTVVAEPYIDGEGRIRARIAVRPN